MTCQVFRVMKDKKKKGKEDRCKKMKEDFAAFREDILENEIERLNDELAVSQKLPESQANMKGKPGTSVVPVQAVTQVSLLYQM